MPASPIFCPIPKTRLTFINVPLVPVRNRRGETWYLCATWGGAMHLFSEGGDERILPYPDGCGGSYSFVRDPKDGFAWAVHTGGKVTRIDVDAGAYDLVQDVPLKELNWGAAVTPEGYLVCETAPAWVMVYDTRRREVAHMLPRVSDVGRYAHHLFTAPDGAVIIPCSVPGVEFVRLDPGTGEFAGFRPKVVRGDSSVSGCVTLLPDGRIAIPRATHVDTVTYPDFGDAPPLEYPGGRDRDWRTFVDFETKRLFAWSADGDPLYALGRDCTWQVFLPRFTPRHGLVAPTMFCEAPEGRLLGLGLFGGLIEFAPDGTSRFVRQLDNLGEQRVSSLAPGQGSRVYTTSFINMSFQEADYRTGAGRNVYPCQTSGGQVSQSIFFDGKLWLGCYSGAEMNVYEPGVEGPWPKNPRPAVEIGCEQMRPMGLESDGRFLWVTTHAKYGKLGGALARVDPQEETCTVWRNLVPDHNPVGLVLDAGTRRAYVGTTIHADCNSAQPASGPATVFAFDLDREELLWVAKPDPQAEALRVLAVPEGLPMLITAFDGVPTIVLLDPDTGDVARTFASRIPADWEGVEFLVGPDGKLYAASSRGFFEYDLERGPGDALVDGPVARPRPRGQDLFFIRSYQVGVAENLWGT